MKTAILALAMTTTATFAFAQEGLLIDENASEEVTLESTAEPFTVISSDNNNDGTLTITTLQDGVYTLTAVACLPLMSSILDEDSVLAELSGSASGALMDEILRGTTRHEIATYACDGA